MNNYGSWGSGSSFWMTRPGSPAYWLYFCLLTDVDGPRLLKKVIAQIEQCAEARTDWRLADDNREGVRVFLDASDCKGWFLLRLSVHDPIMPLNIESDTQGGVQAIARQLLEVLQSCAQLDLSVMRAFLND